MCKCIADLYKWVEYEICIKHNCVSMYWNEEDNGWLCNCRNWENNQACPGILRGLLDQYKSFPDEVSVLSRGPEGWRIIYESE
jgi:hypothetical protein